MYFVFYRSEDEPRFIQTNLNEVKSMMDSYELLDKMPHIMEFPSMSMFVIKGEIVT